ncbi:MAG TPA: hypothetical protein VGF93_20865 [Solirubrobacteraceae bacterium]|jgi:hypothetical protein
MATRVGLAHVAAVSFLAARVAPSGAFWLALAGGTAVAREADLRGVRAGYASSAAAMLQTVAMVGPLRLSAPLTQALSAPLLGGMHARGRRWLSMLVVCLAIRLAIYAALTSFTVFVLLGPAGYAGSFDALFGWLPLLPEGLAGALLITAIANLVSAVFFSTIQVVLYRRALSAWPEPAAAQPPRSAAPPSPVERSGADPRMVVAVAAAVTTVLLFTHSWIVLSAVTVWLAGAAVLARDGDREVAKIGLLLAVMLAAGTLIASLVGGLSINEAASRTVRAALLVLVATWMRVAAGSGGLREAFRRGLLAIRRLPGAEDAAHLLSDLDSGRLLAGSATALQDRLRGVRRRPIAVADAVLGWVAQEAQAIGPEHADATKAVLTIRLRDATLAASVLLPAAALVAAIGS